jgi:hypothetical protein
LGKTAFGVTAKQDNGKRVWRKVLINPEGVEKVFVIWRVELIGSESDNV